MSSSYFKARRKRGACYGTLWKQHSSTNTPSNEMIHNLYSFHKRDKSKMRGKKQLERSSSSSSSSISSTSSSSTSRKESKMHKRYLGMVDEEDDDEKRKETKKGVQSLTAALEKNERAKCYEFCVLVGNTLTGYENLTSFRRGDHPTVSEQVLFFSNCKLQIYFVLFCFVHEQKTFKYQQSNINNHLMWLFS